MEDQKLSRVVVTDVQMPFGSMVAFMVKWAIASIPAVLLVVAIGYAAYTALLVVNELLRVVFRSAAVVLFAIGGLFIVSIFGAVYSRNRSLSKAQRLALALSVAVWIAAVVAAAGYSAGYRLVSPAEWWASR